MSASTSYFAQPVLGRTQLVLIPTTLDDAIPDGHDVRMLDELLRGQDWSAWEAEYSAGRGQPPIPPRVVASVILYGLLHRIRSSRVLEYMTGHNVDFMWLAEGRTIDHTTICKFRTRFKKQLKDLFRGLGRLAMTMGLIRLGEVTFDGTRVKANNGRDEIWTAAAVEKRLAELEAQFGQALEEAERTDAAEDEQFGLLSPPALPPELADAKARQQRLQEALEQLKAADAARRREGIDRRNPAQLPSTDSDSTILPNKEGGYAPNYTPTAAVDTHRDFIVDAEVIPDANENTETVPMVDRVEEAFGQRPEAVLGDGLNATGPNIVELEQRGVEFLSPWRRANPPRETRRCGPIPGSRSRKRRGRSCRSARTPRSWTSPASCSCPKRTCTTAPAARAAVREDQAGCASGAEDHLGCLSLRRLCRLPLGRSVRVGQEPRRPDDHPRLFHADRERHAAKMRSRRPHPLRTSFSCWRDALRLAEARAGIAAVPVAGPGEGPAGVAVGVYRLQFEQTDPGGETTAREFAALAAEWDELKKLGDSRPPFFRAAAGLTSVFRSAKPCRSLAARKKHEIARRGTKSVVPAETKSTARKPGAFGGAGGARL